MYDSSRFNFLDILECAVYIILILYTRNSTSTTIVYILIHTYSYIHTISYYTVEGRGPITGDIHTYIHEYNEYSTLLYGSRY